MEQTAEFWRKCSACKKPIALKAKYFVCSVSTCNGQRTGYVFCSMTCFEAHLPGARHRDAGAVEKQAPNVPYAASEVEAAAPPRRVFVPSTSSSPTSSAGRSHATGAAIPRETLVVVSKVKDYIRARSEMNTSDAIMMLLSDRIRQICDEAIDKAREEGRKTVLDRDLYR